MHSAPVGPLSGRGDGARSRGVYPGWFMTGDAQLLVNAGFDGSGALHDRRVGILGLRLTALLE